MASKNDASISVLLTYPSHRHFFGSGPIEPDRSYYHDRKMALWTSNGSLTADVWMTIDDAPKFVDAMVAAALNYSAAGYHSAKNRAIREMRSETTDDRKAARVELADAFEAAAKRLRESKKP